MPQGGPIDITADTEAAGRLATLRGHLQAIADSSHPDDKLFVDTVNANIRSQDLPSWPHRAVELTRQEPVHWLLGASDTQLLRFIADNAERQRANQDSFVALLPDLKEQALHYVGRAVEQGVVPPIARPLAELTLDQTAYVALDAIGSAEFFCRAYYDGAGVMGMADAYAGWQDQQTLTRVFTHETFHGLNMRAKAGLFDILPKKGLPALRLAEELWTEYVTQVSHYGNPEVISANERPGDHGSYAWHRELGGVVLADIDPGLIGEAYLEPLIGGRFPARKELDRQLRRNFPEYGSRRRNILHAISAELNKTPIVDQTNVLEAWINRLSPSAIVEHEMPSDAANVRLVLQPVFSS